ncbi:MAG: DUF1330 domain-containing protein [Dehalococcoidia bacterium]
MSIYAVAQLSIHDRDLYSQYEAGFGEIFARYGGEMIAVDDAPEVLEGDETYSRCVIMRFPDRESLMAWYRSGDYQALAAIRWRASTGTAVAIRARD